MHRPSTRHAHGVARRLAPARSLERLERRSGRTARDGGPPDRRPEVGDR